MPDEAATVIGTTLQSLQSMEQLQDLLDLEHSGLLDMLEDKRVLTNDQKQHLTNQPTRYQKIAYMINLLRSLSPISFVKFIASLRETKQEHIIQEIDMIIVTASMELVLDNSVTSQDLRKLEDRVCSAVDSDAIMHKLFDGKGIYATTEHRSRPITLTFLCLTQISHIELKQMYDSPEKEIDRELTSYLRPKFIDNGLSAVRLHISIDEFSQNTRIQKPMSHAHRQSLLDLD